MATVKIKTPNGVNVFHNVVHIWNTSVHGDRLNGLELVQDGSIELIFSDGDKTLINAALVQRISLEMP